MPYVTQEYYDEEFCGEPVDAADFPRLRARAEEIVEEMCCYRIRGDRIESYSPEKQERIKQAICAEIEYLDANGCGDIDYGQGVQSASLGKYSYTASVGANGSAQSIYSPRAIRILVPTGLLYRGGCP